MSNTLLPGGFRKGLLIQQAFIAINMSGLANSEMTVETPFALGRIPDDRHDYTYNDPSQFLPFQGAPGSDEAGANIVLAFARSSAHPGEGCVVLNAADAIGRFLSSGADANALLDLNKILTDFDVNGIAAVLSDMNESVRAAFLTAGAMAVQAMIDSAEYKPA